MIAKADLLHGAYYEGHCRNASIARWNAETNRFVYWRYKFGDTFAEDINHPEDDNGYDLFKPYRKVDQPEREIPLVA